MTCIVFKYCIIRSGFELKCTLMGRIMDSVSSKSNFIRLRALSLNATKNSIKSEEGKVL